MSRAAVIGLAAAIGAAAVALRLAALDDALWGDELFTWAIVTADSPGAMLRGVRATENTPPAFYALSWLATEVGGSRQAARLPSLLGGLAAVGLTGGLAARAFGRPAAGLAAAALAAFSPFAIFYATEARAYGAMSACVAGALLALIALLDEDTGRRRALLAVCAAAAVWLHYTAALPLAAAGAWVLLTRPDRRRGVLVAGAATAVLYAPWLPSAGANGMQAVIAALDPLGADNLLRDPVRALVGHPFTGVRRSPGLLALGLLAAGAAAGLVALARRRAWRGGGALGVLVAGAVAAPAGLALHALLEYNLLNPRNLLASAPAALALLGGLLAAGRSRAHAALAVAALLALGVAGARSVGEDLRRPPYGEAAALLDRRAAPGEPVLEAPLFPASDPPREALRLPLRRPHPHVFSDRQEQAWALGLRRGRVWVVRPLTVEIGPLEDPRFALESRRRLRGVVDLEVSAYVPRAGR